MLPNFKMTHYHLDCAILPGSKSQERKMYNPWFQLVSSLIYMIMIANLQYGWTLFVNPIRDAHAWQLSEIQDAFAFFILLQISLQPRDRCFIYRIGLRRIITVVWT